LGLARGDAVLEEAAGGEEFGVEKSGTSGATDEVVGEQREFHVEQRTFADAADDGGHAIAGVNVAARLRAILLFEDDDWVADGGGERGEDGVHFEVS
jgi:hypothetical protein